jgi:hypothetical protein
MPRSIVRATRAERHNCPWIVNLFRDLRVPAQAVLRYLRFARGCAAS